jgi:predicted ribosomally synthesized peptide with nif11-like leader
MGIEDLKKYGKMCEEDEKIRARAKEIGIKDLDGQIAYAKTLGLDFSKEDFNALASEAGLDGKNELSEEELKKVAGGFLSTTLAAAVVGFLAAGLAGGAAAGNKPGW